MLSQRKWYPSNPLSAMQFHPYRSPAHFGQKGILLGINVKTGKYVFFHPWWMKRLELIDACSILIDGLRGSAKSGVEKCMFGRFMGLNAGVLDGIPQEARGQMNSRKRVAGDPEEQAFTEFLGSKVTDLSQFAPNVFDPLMKMSEKAVVRSAIINGQYANNHNPLSNETKGAYQVAAMLMMSKFPAYQSGEVFMDILSRLTIDDLTAYYGSQGQQFRDMITEELLNDQDELKLDYGQTIEGDEKHSAAADEAKQLKDLILLQQQPMLISQQQYLQEDFLRGASQGVLLWQEVMRLLGASGGTKNSLYEVRRQTMTTYDWSDVDEDARSLYEINFMAYDTAAINSGDLSTIPHYVGWDEEQEGHDNLTHLQATDRRSRKARQSHEVDIRISQFELSLRYAGDPGTEIRRRSISINDGVSIHMDGRQPDSPEYREWLQIRGYSPAEAEYLCTKIPKGVIGLKVRGMPAVFVNVVRAAPELAYTETDSVEASMTDDDVILEMLKTKKIWEELMKQPVEIFGEQALGKELQTSTK